MAGVLVERAERLVAQKNVRLAREGARDRDALAHAARERMGKIMLVAGEAEPAEPRRRNGEPLVARDLVELEPERDVIDRAAPGHQPVVLEHDADLAAEPVELDEGIGPVNQHPALRGAPQPRAQAQGLPLAAARL